jgi:class 3 adenylate cyclase
MVSMKSAPPPSLRGEPPAASIRLGTPGDEPNSRAIRVERRLAKVLAADVAGYSRLMGADEVGTLVALGSEPDRVFLPDNGTVEIYA